MDKSTKPKSSYTAAAITLCVSPATIEKFIDAMTLYDKHIKSQTKESAMYASAVLYDMGIEIRTNQALRQLAIDSLKSSSENKNATV